MNKIVSSLLEISDPEYLKYSKNVVKGSSPIIGIRIPDLRKITKDLMKQNQIDDFFKEYEGVYFEEKLIKGFIIASNQEYFNKYIDDYIKELDSWCLVDTFCNSCKFFSSNQDKYWELVKELLKSSSEFIIRTGYVLILYYYLNDLYIDKVIDLLLVESDYYYVNMAIAWVVSEIYIKYPERVVKILTDRKLNDFVHEKAIDKINDSFRVSREEKRSLRMLK